MHIFGLVRITLHSDRPSVSYRDLLVCLSSRCESVSTVVDLHSGTANIHRPRSTSPPVCFWMSWLQLTPAQHSRFKYDYPECEGVRKGYIIACAPMGHVNCNCSRSQTTFWFREHSDAIYGEVWSRRFLAEHPKLVVKSNMSYGYFTPTILELVD